MNILALDTCTEYCSAALLYLGQRYQHNELTQRGHSDLILGMIEQLLDQAHASLADIDVLVFGCGPGSFTGVRVGVGVAQGIAFARDIPVVPVSTLAAVAQNAAKHTSASHISVAIDARMGEIYCAHYRVINGLVVLIDDEQVCPPEAFMPHFSAQNWVGVGTGWAQYETILKNNYAESLDHIAVGHYPLAENMIMLAEPEIAAGNVVKADQAMPVYLRNNVAKKKGEQ